MEPIDGNLRFSVIDMTSFFIEIEGNSTKSGDDRIGQVFATVSRNTIFQTKSMGSDQNCRYCDSAVPIQGMLMKKRAKAGEFVGRRLLMCPPRRSDASTTSPTILTGRGVSVAWPVVP